MPPVAADCRHGTQAAPWPAPAPLEGVKSRARQLFGIKSAAIEVSMVGANRREAEFCSGGSCGSTASTVGVADGSAAAVGEGSGVSEDSCAAKASGDIEGSRGVTCGVGRTASGATESSVACEKVTKIKISGVSLALESRIAAVGEASRILVEMLLGKEAAVSGTVSRHTNLSVAHLGPHLADSTATAEQFAVAMAAALRGRPQVVIVDEAVGAGAGAAWLRTFRNVVRSEALRAFRGAVVICSHEETFAVRRICSQRWAAISDGSLVQTEITGRSLDVIEDALRADLETGGAPTRKKRAKEEAADEPGALLEEARELSQFCFEEDLDKRARTEGWTVTFLAETEADGTRSLRGYLCHRLLPAPRAELHVERLAVPTRHRGRGHARQLMRWLLGEAARMPRSECASLTCSAFVGVVPFYRALGFVPTERPSSEPKARGEEAEEEEDPQTWMALRNASVAA